MTKLFIRFLLIIGIFSTTIMTLICQYIKSVQNEREEANKLNQILRQLEQRRQQSKSKRCRTMTEKLALDSLNTLTKCGSGSPKDKLSKITFV